MAGIKTLRNTCRQADSIESTLTTQEHLDDLNLFMSQRMNTVGLARVKGISTASEKIAEDAKKFSLYTSLDPEKEEKESEESRRYLEEILGSLESDASQTSLGNSKVPNDASPNNIQSKQKQSALTDLDNLMAILK